MVLSYWNEIFTLDVAGGGGGGGLSRFNVVSTLRHQHISTHDIDYVE